ncbi:MAG: anaerobic ribonucleoside-triphosphate reductase activating protein, partial [Oscillospiraceae bacterium]
GIRYVIFTQGCPHNCKGCHNPETHDFNGGNFKSIDEIFNEISANPLLKGVTFSGGEPFCQQDSLVLLSQKIKELNKDIWCYTGYLYEDIKDTKLIDYIDVLVDGPFIEQQKDLLLKFRGSQNQRIIDVKKTKQQNKIVILYE